MPEVVVQELVKQFGQVVAVDRVSLEVKDGTLTTLLGPSGCGKTTILRCVAGLEDPNEGEIRIGTDTVYSKGKNVPPEKRKVGMVFQSYAIWPHMTVYNNIAFPLKIKRTPEQETRAKVRAVMSKVRLEGLENRPATDLSGGQQQRVALARALVHDPRVLLLDEPLSNLDAELRDHMRVELREIQRSFGITTVYVTHDQVEALSISDQIIVLNAGKIVSIGTPKEIYVRPNNRFVASFVGKTNFIPGKVSSGAPEDHLVRVETDLGTILCHTHGAEVDRASDVLVAIKPENVLVSNKPHREAVNVFEGKVEVVSYLGGHMELLVSSGSQSIKIQSHPDDAGLEEGAKVYVKFPPNQCALIKP